jgi:hypothetical protein
MLESLAPALNINGSKFGYHTEVGDAHSMKRIETSLYLKKFRFIIQQQLTVLVWTDWIVGQCSDDHHNAACVAAVTGVVGGCFMSSRMDVFFQVPFVISFEASDDILIMVTQMTRVHL